MKLLKKLPLYLLIGMLVCTGCKSNAQQNQITSEQKVTEVGEVAAVQEVSEVEDKEQEVTKEEVNAQNHSPENIIINQLGYLPNDAKQVVFRGDALDESFQIVKADNHEVVYEGKIGEGKKNNAADEKI